VRAAYARGETDEFVAATTVGAEGAHPPAGLRLAFNFRPDRMRQLTGWARAAGSRATHA
jgi:2,3-bisphosphoglycerate-independent phosphoglycerate mutase